MKIPKVENWIDLKDPEEASYWVEKLKPWPRYQIEIAISLKGSRDFLTVKQCLTEVFPLPGKDLERRLKENGVGFGD